MTHRFSSFYAALTLGVILCAPLAARAADEQTSEYRLIGLFSPDREQDLRTVLDDVPEIELVKVDYDNARVTLRYDLRKLFTEFNPKKPPTALEIEQHLDKVLAEASDHTFNLKPIPALPKEKLTKISLTVGICDCKGCRYAAYLAVSKVDGVEQATVTADSVVTAWVDPAKVDRAALESALKKARIEHIAKP